MTTPTSTKLALKYPQVVAAWHAFREGPGRLSVFEETDFESLALGFFIALGIDGDGGTVGEPYYEAKILSFDWDVL